MCALRLMRRRICVRASRSRACADLSPGTSARDCRRADASGRGRRGSQAIGVRTASGATSRHSFYGFGRQEIQSARAVISFSINACWLTCTNYRRPGCQSGLAPIVVVAELGFAHKSKTGGWGARAFITPAYAREAGSVEIHERDVLIARLTGDRSLRAAHNRHGGMHLRRRRREDVDPHDQGSLAQRSERDRRRGWDL